MGDAARLEKYGTPKISLDHIIKERYPTFVDALRDLDDALSLLFLFANLPFTSTVPPKTIALCRRLCLEFEHYLITTYSLRKSFLSIKGIYYQATIQGQDILWLVPYKFVQRVTGDVDFRIMGTFVEFYTTLLGFVNFRLYTSIGLVYPPKFNSTSDEQGAELGAFTLEGKGIGSPLQIASNEPQTNGSSHPSSEPDPALQKQVDSLISLPEPSTTTETENADAAPHLSEPNNDTIDTFVPTALDSDVLAQPMLSTSQASSLFSSFTVFLSRETPRAPLEFILRAFGCKRVGWDAVLGEGAFTNNERDGSITHQVVDRPSVPASSEQLTSVPNGSQDNYDENTQSVPQGYRIPGRTYIQPQWVWDCINEGKLLRPDLYAPGATLPPHLSPFVRPGKGEYDPREPVTANGEAEDLNDEVDGQAEEEEETPQAATNGPTNPLASSQTLLNDPPSSPDNLINDMAVAASDSNSTSPSEASDSDNAPSSFSGFASRSPSPPPDTHQAELEAEALGLPVPLGPTETTSTPLKGILKHAGEGVAKQNRRRRREEEEELERRKMMMGRRKRKVYEQMAFGIARKEGEAEKLRGKRRRVERERERGVGSGR